MQKPIRLRVPFAALMFSLFATATADESFGQTAYYVDDPFAPFTLAQNQPFSSPPAFAPNQPPGAPGASPFAQPAPYNFGTPPSMTGPGSASPFGQSPSSFSQTGDPARRTASVPEIFGDSSGSGLGFVDLATGAGLLSASFPVTYSAGHIAENNKAIPVRRVYFVYNYFHNAYEFNSHPAAGEMISRDIAVNQYTIGAELPFWDGTWSLEARLPFANRYDERTDDAFLQGGVVGNLGLILKKQIYADPITAISAGLGIDVPTGEDFDGEFPAVARRLEVDNQAVHLSPYIGFLVTPTDRLFYQAFGQLDFAANGNSVEVRDAVSGDLLESETIDPQTLLRVDLSGGYWLYRAPPCGTCGAMGPYPYQAPYPALGSPMLTGLAVLLELHYTASLESPDEAAVLGSTLKNPLGNFNVVNATVGLHAEVLQNTSLRVGGVFPLSGSGDRFFDGELILAVISRF